jgi:peptidoglycan/LPS O-acetylase OafA/YrhL
VPRETGSSAPAGSTALTGEIRSLTGLRAVAATWVVVYHLHFTPGIGYEGVWAPLRPLVRAGATGVDLFYVLSGFVITLTYLDKVGRRPSLRATGTFLWARICRIWPVYVVVVTLYGGWLLLKATRVHDGNLAYQTVQPVIDLPHYLLQLSMVQLWWHPYSGGESWLGSTWSISAEWLAYVAFPVVALVLYRLRRLPVWLLGVLATAAMLPTVRVIYETGGPTNAWSWLWRIAGGFIAGALVCLAVRRIRITPRVERIAAWVAVLAVAEIVIELWWGDWRGVDNVSSAFGAVSMWTFPVLVGALALSRTGISRLLSSRLLVHGGRISFSLYLVHVPVYEVFWTVLVLEPRIAPGTGLWALLVPHVFLLTFVLAHLLYRYVEEPARRALRRLVPARPARAARPARPAPAASTTEPLPGTPAAEALGVQSTLAEEVAVGRAGGRPAPPAQP